MNARLAVSARLVPVGLGVVAGAAALASGAWSPQQSGVTVRFRGVSAVNERVAWASGASGTVVRTTDGGRTWRERVVPGAEALDFRDVDAFDERTAYVLSIGSGEASRIYKTTDGGATWARQFTNEDTRAFFDAMAFWDTRRGVAVSDSVDGHFVILVTVNGGRTWTRVPEAGLPPALPDEGAFAASGTNVTVAGRDRAWFATGASRVLRTSDGGRTWAVATTPLATGPSAGIFSVAFRDGRHGVVVGGDYRMEGEASNNVAVTDDGGVTWTLARGLSGFRSVVAYLPGRKGSLIAVGPSGADESDDDGLTWKPIAGTGTGLHAFSIAPRGGVGWAAGESGRIARFDLR